jgi:hypothetical protein
VATRSGDDLYDASAWSSLPWIAFVWAAVMMEDKEASSRSMPSLACWSKLPAFDDSIDYHS